MSAGPDVKVQNARMIAHLLGDLRETAKQLDGEIDRTTYYSALIKHKILGDELDLAFTDAPDAVFDAIDTNGNGTLSMQELEEGVLSLVSDDDGALSKVQDLLALGNDVMRTSMRQMADKLSGQASRVIDLFKKWDVNGDGSISKREFARAMPMLGLSGHTSSEIDSLFSSFDPDLSGEITFRELYKMLRHNPNEYAHGEIAVKEKAAPVKVEEPIDLNSLRRRIKLDMFKMEVENEVLKYTKSRPGRGANNPTIVVQGLFTD